MSYAPEIDVTAVVDDIATHIKNQFEGILARVSKDQLTLQENVNMILNLPIVKGLLEEKKELLAIIEKLEKENKNLKMQQQAFSEPAIENTKNISLEVREIDSDTSSVTKEEIVEHIKAKELEALKKQVDNISSGYQYWKQQTSNIESNLAQTQSQLSSFNVLGDSDDEPIYSTQDEDDDEDEDEENKDEDEDEDEEEDDEDEEEENEDEDDGEDEDDEENEDYKSSNIIKTVVMAQNAGKYATIDSDSEEDEESPQKKQFTQFAGSEKVKIINKTEEEEEEEEEEEGEEEEEEFDVEEIELEGVKYYTTDPDNGIVYECMDDGEIGEEMGRLEEGNLFLS